MCFFFFNRGNTEGINSSKVLCLMFVYACVFRFVWTCVGTGIVDFREVVALFAGEWECLHKASTAHSLRHGDQCREDQADDK